MFYTGFRIQHIGINEKPMVVRSSLRNHKKEHWFYNGFRIQPIGINEKALVFVKHCLGINEKQ